MGAYYLGLFGLVMHLCAVSHYLPIFYASSSSLLFLAGVVHGQGPSNTMSDYDDCLHQRCGNLSVAYPFTIGLKSTCPSFKLSADDTNFTLSCTDDVLILGTNLPVLHIFNDSVIIDLSTDLKSSFNSTATSTSGAPSCNLSADANEPSVYFAEGGPYIAAADNKFGSFGCSAGFVFTYQTENATAYDTGGCEPFCGFNTSNFPHLDTSSYSGCGNNLNCCISSFPAHAKKTYYKLMLLAFDPFPCSSFAVPFHPDYTDLERGSYGFRVLWALHDPDVVKQITTWSSNRSSNASVFNVADLPGNISTACTPGNTSQVNISADVVPGYLCSCLPGYTGDGYVNGTGCADIDECSTGANNMCVREAECRNTPPGSYTCHCKSRWHVGDGKRDGTGCPTSPSLIKALAITGGVMGLMLLLFSIIYAIIMVNRKKKERCFGQNGGFELQAYLLAETGRQTTRFYTAKELRVATQNFSEHLKLGTGGFGTVYKGTLEDGRLVAVKKANRPGEVDRNQFLNELVILTQIHHRNIVRLYGCCLETTNPLFVYEFVSKGDLAENLASPTAMGWAKRLQVASQVADALAYLHAKSSPPILHRDVKTANILLDNNLHAKVADFGISKLIPEGTECVLTAVQGTVGYLDPEYFRVQELTDKSDVYSLGVVLVELITGLKAVDTRRGIKFANLALFFLKKMAEDGLLWLIDERLKVHDDDDMQQVVASEGNWRLHTSIQGVAKLAERCLASRGVERPSMSELAHDLIQLTNAFNNHDLFASQSNLLEELRPLVPSYTSEYTEDGDL